ncbi:hypothetical protein ACIRP0_02565 [Streptomyces sp. NPDC101733]|uniref:hypothetical protein n=1 Tax=unclassified Streptomyces TaxID=2593676 RepID=UPI00381DC082
MVPRRLVAGLAALALVAEAVVLVLVNLVLAATTANQSMSIGGTDPALMSKATYGLGAVTGGFLLLCAVLLAVAAVRDRSPGGPARLVLVVAAVVHALLGVVAVAIVGWGAFVATTTIFCLLVLFLMLYGRSRREELTPTSP